MNIEVKCNNCDKNLVILHKVLVPGMDTLRLEVAPCGNVDCNNCSKCEDALALQKAQEEMVVLRSKLADAGLA